ncbi:MAG: ankyrin repeat domain-containing protein, partial [Gammaproteobacteria bacterium]|nr:ankyrin repeat domain-containing protein [Gammaproteobacteria bacterium]
MVAAMALAPIGAVAGEYEGLADAAMHRDMVAVRSLLEQGADVNAPGPYDTPALHWVVRVQDLQMAGRLLDAGADPNLANRYGVSPLHLSIENRDADMVVLLLAAGSDPNLPDGAGETPLFLAARAGSADIVEALLAHGASVDAQDAAYRQTPLMVAVREGHAEVVERFLAHGANVNAQTVAGPAPRFRLPAENAGSKGVGIIRGGWPERGVRQPVPGGKTPLLYATREGYLRITALLLEAGADLEQADANG